MSKQGSKAITPTTKHILICTRRSYTSETVYTSHWLKSSSNLKVIKHHNAL